MELTVGRSELLKGGAIGFGACALSFALGVPVESFSGSAGILLGLLLATAVASWYAGRWVGLLTTLTGALVASYILPPNYSLHITEPKDFGAIYSFAIVGVIISLLCGAAWQLRMEARAITETGNELARLRSENSDLVWRAQHQDAALRASEELLGAFARAALSRTDESLEFAARLVQGGKARIGPVDCGPLAKGLTLPTVWGDERDVRLLFEILTAHSPQFRTGRLPGFWLFTAVFPKPESTKGPAPALTELERSACQQLIARQGGRAWTASSGNGDWELRFLLPSARQSA